MIVSTKYVKEKRKSYHTCVCDDCGCSFVRRTDHNNHATCTNCSNIRGGKKRRTHGHNNGNSKLHVVWQNMKRRCDDKTNKKYKLYGGRGITVCESWKDFVPFMEWSNANGYDEKKTIDRRDNDLGYSPDNCRYVSINHQNANKRITDKNKTGYIGVSFQKGKFVANVQWLGKQNYIGRFVVKEDAAKARDKYIIDNELPHTLNFS